MYPLFPLIQLPRKSEATNSILLVSSRKVSINSTSEEVRSLNVARLSQLPELVSFH